MRSALLLVISLSILAFPVQAEEIVFSVPSTIEVFGNGLNCVAFNVKLKGLPPEVEEYVSYSMKGLPAEAPGFFDRKSKLFFWRPRSEQIGTYKFEFLAEGPTVESYSRDVTIRVLKAPSLEALPRGWADMKKEEKYLLGRECLPANHYLEMDIAAVPGYELEITVRDSLDQECVLRYVPGEGRAEINKKRRSALIKLGGEYASEEIKKVRRDLYEDLYNTLGLIFKDIESIRLSGAYLLDNFRVYDRPSLIAAAESWDITPPSLNLSFDDRFYEAGIYSKENPMLIADVPVIKIDFNTPSGVVWQRGRLLIDKTEYRAVKGDFSLVVVKPSKASSSFDVDYVMYLLRIHPAKKLPFGEHLFMFEAENAFGMVISQEVFARVVTLPTQVLGKPLVYPSPFSPGIHSHVNIQYKLSMQANIEIAVFGVDGSTILRRRFYMGEEGAKKGINTVEWEGKTNAGMAISNGIYTGVIIDRDENRILEKFKIAVYR
jgi:hypothetical protein